MRKFTYKCCNSVIANAYMFQNEKILEEEKIIFYKIILLPQNKICFSFR